MEVISEQRKKTAIQRIEQAIDSVWPPSRQAEWIVNAMLDLFAAEPRSVDLSTQDLKACCDAWKGTLEHFGIDRPVLPYEQMAIAQLVSQYEDKAVIYALTGMRFEEKTASFNPAKNLAIRRCTDPKLFEKFVNLASQKATAQKKREQERNLPPIPRESVSHWSETDRGEQR